MSNKLRLEDWMLIIGLKGYWNRKVCLQDFQKIKKICSLDKRQKYSHLSLFSFNITCKNRTTLLLCFHYRNLTQPPTQQTDRHRNMKIIYHLQIRRQIWYLAQHWWCYKCSCHYQTSQRWQSQVCCLSCDCFCLHIDIVSEIQIKIFGIYTCQSSP